MPSARRRSVLASELDTAPTMREAMRLVREGEGFDISEASDGDEALAGVHDDPPDLMLLDMSIPGTTGPDVLAAVKADVMELAAEYPLYGLPRHPATSSRK